MADGIHARPHPMEPSSLDASSDGVLAQPQGQHLRTRNHTILPLRKSRNRDLNAVSAT
jgi:hypothetical protein